MWTREMRELSGASDDQQITVAFHCFSSKLTQRNNILDFDFSFSFF